MPGAAGPVLVVEDDVGLRSYLATLLEELGFRVIEAESGEQALALLGDESAQLAVLDLTLPGMDGFAVADMLPDEVPVIFVTGDPVRAYAEAHVRRHDYRVLPKPIAPELFEHAVHEALGLVARGPL